MSIQALNWALAQDQIENSPARFVLLVLSNYADADGNCFPSREHIAKKTALSVSTVQRQLNWLVKKGYIEKQRRRQGDRITSSAYTVVWGS